MHDLDRTQLEVGENYEGAFDLGEMDYEETMELESESIFGEAMELELAAELLSVSSDQELDQFLGDLIKKAGRAVGKIVKSPTFRAIGGMLKGVAKTALPMAGTALGTFLGGPVGGTIGGKLGSLGASLIKEVDLEGLSPDERELEIARKFVQLAGQTVNRLANMPPTINPVAAAQKALSDAAQKVLPLVSSGGNGFHPGGRRSRARSGRWIRSGRNIIVLGA